MHALSINFQKKKNLSYMCTDADLSNCVLLPLIFFFHIPCFLYPYILDSKIIVIMFYSLQVRTVKVTNVSLSATVQDIKEFFSFSGDIEHVEMQRFIFFKKNWNMYPTKEI